MTNQEIQNLLKQQAAITTFEVASMCADTCDAYRGNLLVGNMIRSHFNLSELEKILPKRDHNETPVLEPKDVIVSIPVSSNPTPPKKVHSITRVK